MISNFRFKANMPNWRVCSYSLYQCETTKDSEIEFEKKKNSKNGARPPCFFATIKNFSVLSSVEGLVYSSEAISPLAFPKSTAPQFFESARQLLEIMSLITESPLGRLHTVWINAASTSSCDIEVGWTRPSPGSLLKPSLPVSPGLSLAIQHQQRLSIGDSAIAIS